MYLNELLELTGICGKFWFINSALPTVILTKFLDFIISSEKMIQVFIITKMSRFIFNCLDDSSISQFFTGLKTEKHTTPSIRH